MTDALREDIAPGRLTPVVELAHADTFAGYLEMATDLNDQGTRTRPPLSRESSITFELA